MGLPDGYDCMVLSLTGLQAAMSMAATTRSVSFAEGLYLSFILFMSDVLLFCTEKDGDGYAVEIPYLAYAVLHIAFIWIADVLRQVAEEDELRIVGWQLGDVFYFYPLTFDRRGWVLLLDDGEQQFV